MDTKSAHEGRINFSGRLKSALSDAGLSEKIGDFTRAFNARADGSAVSIHATRKWLCGEAIPTHERILILAVWLGVNAAWLQFGEADESVVAGDIVPEAIVSTPVFVLMTDVLSLPTPAQQAIREIVDAFLRLYGLAKH